MNVFACPGRWDTVQSAESLCAAWEILWLLENLGKPMGKHGFRALSVQNKKQPPTVTFPGKERFQNITFAHQPIGRPWKSLGKHGPCLVGPKSTTTAYGSLSWQRAMSKKNTSLDLQVQAIRSDIRGFYMERFLPGG